MCVSAGNTWQNLMWKETSNPIFRRASTMSQWRWETLGLSRPCSMLSLLRRPPSAVAARWSGTVMAAISEPAGCGCGGCNLRRKKHCTGTVKNCAADLDMGCCGLVEEIPPQSRWWNFQWGNRAWGLEGRLSQFWGWRGRGDQKILWSEGPGDWWDPPTVP